MANKEYYVDLNCDVYDGEYICEIGEEEFGIENDGMSHLWNVVPEDINEALLESEEFIQAAKESGFDSSFTELDPYEVYEEMLNEDVEEMLFADFGNYENIENEFTDLKSSVESVISKILNFVRENDDIKLNEDSVFNDFFDLSFTFIASEDNITDIKKQIEAYIKEINLTDYNKKLYYKEPNFGILFAMLNVNFNGIEAFNIEFKEYDVSQ